MFLSKHASLRSILPEEEPEEFDDLDVEEFAKEANYSFQPEQLKDQNVFLPDNTQNKMWAIYKYGGKWDLGEGDGEKMYPPGDPHILGALTGQFSRQMHKATKIAKGGSKASPGPINKAHWNTMMKAIKSYDPLLYIKNHPEIKGAFRPKQEFTGWVIGSTQPERMAGGASGQNIAGLISGNKAVGSGYYGDLTQARSIMNEYEDSMGHPIPSNILAKRLGKPEIHVKKLMAMMAPEYDPDNTIDDRNSMAELSLSNKDAIRTVYADANEKEKRMMEWMFPTMFTQKIIPPKHAVTSDGKVQNNWMASQLGMSKEQSSRLRTKKIIPAIKRQAGLPL